MLPSFINKRFIITGLLVAFSVGFLGFFEESDTVSPVVQGFIVSAVFFLAIPVLYSKIILGESLGNMGLQRGNAFIGAVSGAACVGLGIIASVLLIKLTPFRDQYMLPALAELNFLWFVLYEVILVAFVALLYEVFFRGFIQLSWLRDTGAIAWVVQLTLFYLFFYLSGSFTWQYAPILLFAPLSGVIAQSSRSIWYSFVSAWLYLFITDVLILALH